MDCFHAVHPKSILLNHPKISIKSYSLAKDGKSTTVPSLIRDGKLREKMKVIFSASFEWRYLNAFLS